METLEEAFANAPIKFSESERPGAVKFIQRCLTFDPLARPSAKDLLEDPWLQLRPAVPIES